MDVAHTVPRPNLGGQGNTRTVLGPTLHPHRWMTRMGKGWISTLVGFIIRVAAVC